ncbi:asd [Scenedesmus sp. PABB004]|nr:asd [Scenedesmus sp. PABB004]
MQLRGGMQSRCARPGVAARPARRACVRVAAKQTADGPSIAVVGVTGAVGQEFLQVLKERNFPYRSIKLLASARSAGKQQEFEGQTYTVEELKEDSFDGVDIALFSAGGSISKKFGPVAQKAGSIVVDNSSAFRMTEGVPLVIPEVNPEAMAHVKIGGGGAIIANPNCSTIIALMAVTPLHRLAGVKRMIVSTYQAASGAGAAAMEELREQTRDVLDGKEARPVIFPYQYAFNLFSHNSGMDEALGYNEEELKMVKETKKIWGTSDVAITATCIRVPVMRAHAESINLEFGSDISEADALAALAAFPGVSVIDDRKNNRFPTPLDATTRDDVYVGRVRRDISRKDAKGLDLFVCGDQIKKGAALNAVQIAELLLK